MAKQTDWLTLIPPVWSTIASLLGLAERLALRCLCSRLRGVRASSRTLLLEQGPQCLLALPTTELGFVRSVNVRLNFAREVDSAPYSGLFNQVCASMPQLRNLRALTLSFRESPLAEVHHLLIRLADDRAVAERLTHLTLEGELTPGMLACLARLVALRTLVVDSTPMPMPLESILASCSQMPELDELALLGWHALYNVLSDSYVRALSSLRGLLQRLSVVRLPSIFFPHWALESLLPLTGGTLRELHLCTARQAENQFLDDFIERCGRSLRVLTLYSFLSLRLATHLALMPGLCLRLQTKVQGEDGRAVAALRLFAGANLELSLRMPRLTLLLLEELSLFSCKLTKLRLYLEEPCWAYAFLCWRPPPKLQSFFCDHVSGWDFANTRWVLSCPELQELELSESTGTVVALRSQKQIHVWRDGLRRECRA